MNSGKLKVRPSWIQASEGFGSPRLICGVVLAVVFLAMGWFFLRPGVKAPKLSVGGKPVPCAQAAQTRDADPASALPSATTSACSPSSSIPSTVASPAPFPAPVETLAALWTKIPVGAFRKTLEALDEPSRQHALEKLQRLAVPKEDYASLRASSDGELYYVCDFHAVSQAIQAAAIDTPIPDTAVRTTAAAVATSISSPPVRHSKPGSSQVLYLDFNGHTIQGTSWNSGGNTLEALPYDLDGDPTTFSSTEQANIIQIWERVAEDYSAFDVDVTTEQPATFTSHTGRALITTDKDKNGLDMPSKGMGGVAYMGVFGYSSYVRSYSPALCYYTNVGSVANVAEVISHELGHNMGLSHDGLSSGSTYYRGHGSGETSWGPIMGTGYGRNVSQWSKGDYYDSNNTQDDIALIRSVLGAKLDEAGDTSVKASPLMPTSGTVAVSGVLSDSSDLDIYSFTTGAADISFSASPYRASSSTYGGNADIKLELLDGTSTVVATSDPLATTGATLTYTALPGTYYLRLSSSGTGTPLVVSPLGYTSYGSVGQYSLTGSISSARLSVTSRSAPRTVYSKGSQLSFQATATGTGTLSYQWYRAGLPIAGQTSSTLTIKQAGAADQGAYWLAITDTVVTRRVLYFATYFSGNTQVIGWGDSLYGQATAPSGLVNATDVGAGAYSTAVLKSDGSLLGFGKVFKDYALPSSLKEVVQVSLGDDFCLALDSSGAVTAWGSAASGQTSVPAGLVEVVSVAAGGRHALALKADGSVVAWGADDKGQCKVPSGLKQVVRIAAGPNHSLALKADGSVVAWGDNTYGQSTVPAGLSSVVGIAAANYHSAALSSTGTVSGWGTNFATPPAGLSGVTLLASFAYHTLALCADGSVAAWGLNTFRQIMIPDSLDKVLQVAAGYNHSVALRDCSSDTPVITSQPVSATQNSGTQLVLTVATKGFGYSYQWYKDGVALSGATSASLSVSKLSTTDAGSYTVVVRNGALSATSQAARVSVVVPVVGSIKNLSVRSVAGHNGNPLIVGFVVSGGTKDVLLRATGPALSSFGVAGLPDPKIELHGAVQSVDKVLDSNDNWGDAGAASGMRTLFNKVGAFSITDTASKDAALVASCAGVRTVHVNSVVPGRSGVVLVETYDAGTGASPCLSNVSARNYAGSGLETMIVGFVIDGNQPKKILIRGVGPALSAFGVTGVLGDPRLELHTSINNVDSILATNDNWGTATGVAAASTATGAFALGAGSLDAALYLTLAPGSYTCLVSGANGGSGEALVEVYEVP